MIKATAGAVAFSLTFLILKYSSDIPHGFLLSFVIK